MNKQRRAQLEKIKDLVGDVYDRLEEAKDEDDEYRDNMPETCGNRHLQVQKMNRIMIIGCPGSGKSTFSKALHEITGIPLYHLDMMYWNADRTTVDKAVFRERLSSTLQNNEWIIDGNYGSTIEFRLQACDTVIFLDYPVDVCLNGIRERRGKARTDMPWTENEDEEDAEFVEFIKNYNSQSRPVVMALLNKYPHKDVYIFKSRNEADEFLEHIRP